MSYVFIFRLELLSEREAEVCRCWAKYCLNLLTISKDRLLDDTFQPSPPPSSFIYLNVFPLYNLKL